MRILEVMVAPMCEEHKCLDLIEKEDMTTLYALLTKWREDRHLTIEGQLEGYIPNIMEELVEFMRATTEYDKVDALCDMMVFSFNVLGYLKPDRYANSKESLASISSVYTDDTYKIIDNDTKLLQKILEILPAIIPDNNRINIDRSIIHYCCERLFTLGYDPYLCMLETIKEISSRTGSYDESIGKWVKDTSDEAKAKWYKADYSKCKHNLSLI